MIAGISAVTFNAQSKTWDFSDTSKFPAGAIAADKTVDGLSFVTGGSSLTIATNSLAVFEDVYAPTQRLQFGGNSYSGSTNPAIGTTAMPTRRYIQFAVSDKAVIKFYARGGGAGRSILISDAAGKVLNVTTFAGNGTADIAVTSYTYTGTAGNLIIAAGGGDNSLYKIEYKDNSSLAVSGAISELKSTVFSSGNRIFVKDLESRNTQVSVFSASGVLVKSFKTYSNADFDIYTKGVYVVNLKSEAGEKSVKVMIK